MASAKDLIVKPITSKAARALIKREHYSGKVVNNSSLHLGVYLNDKLEGCMSFGSPMDKRKVLPLVEGTLWNEMLELNRMAFSDALPRNSESRAMSVAFKLIKKHYPHIKWVLSFSDATQCGDGAIYRASGFLLVQVKESKNLAQLPSGEVVHKMTLESNPTTPRKELSGLSYYGLTGGKYDFKKYLDKSKSKLTSGFQIKYVYFIDKSCREKLTVPELPFSTIADMNAEMYKGEKITRDKQAMTDTLGTAAV